MTHNSEDELLGYALKVVASDKEYGKITSHLAECPECRLRLASIQKDIEIMGGVRPVTRPRLMPGPRPQRVSSIPDSQVSRIPKRRLLRLPSRRSRALGVPGMRPHIRWTPTLRPGERVTYAILKTAALIVIGILVGVGASKRIPREPEFVSSSYVTLSPPADSLMPYAVSDATDIPAHYYEQLPGQAK